MPSTISLKSLASLRMVVGASCLLIPRQAGAIWGVPLAAGGESVLFGRMVGIRDFVLGAYLWKRTAEGEKVWKRVGDSATKSPLLKNSSADVSGIPAFAQSSTADGSQETAMANVRSALWLGLICDLVDVVSVGACWVEGVPISGMGEFCIGGGAVLFSAIAGQWLFAGRRV
ncbi:hypothetical protein H2200_011717 [Cladophialophora chaetospira]|uniref:Uncharacterized protein n=1 Tax=Cladophialophora chaetospira TaxID=386627 RepID=A0AA39CCT5_9EURO|nr:hypothetical protein H2200_011717 [Cladophialophora chaetospira]